MVASRTFRSLAVTAAAGLLLTGAACNGRLARRASQPQTPASAVPTVVIPTTAPAAAPAAGQPVRTDDLDAGLQQADTQLSQTGGALNDADQPSQQNSD